MASTTRTPTRTPISFTHFFPEADTGVNATPPPDAVDGPGTAGVSGGAGIGAAFMSWFWTSIMFSSRDVVFHGRSQATINTSLYSTTKTFPV